MPTTAGPVTGTPWPATTTKVTGEGVTMLCVSLVCALSLPGSVWAVVIDEDGSP